MKGNYKISVRVERWANARSNVFKRFLIAHHFDTLKSSIASLMREAWQEGYDYRRKEEQSHAKKKAEAQNK